MKPSLSILPLLPLLAVALSAHMEAAAHWLAFIPAALALAAAAGSHFVQYFSSGFVWDIFDSPLQLLLLLQLPLVFYDFQTENLGRYEGKHEAPLS